MRKGAKVKNKKPGVIGPGGEQRGGGQEFRLEGWIGARLLRAMCTVLKGLTFAQYSMGEQSIL